MIWVFMAGEIKSEIMIMIKSWEELGVVAGWEGDGLGPAAGTGGGHAEVEGMTGNVAGGADGGLVAVALMEEAAERVFDLGDLGFGLPDFVGEDALGFGEVHRWGHGGGFGQDDFEFGDEVVAAGGGLKEHLPAKG
jgi:hypothetical protein